MKRGKLIQWLHCFRRFHSAGRARSHESHTVSPSRRQPYLLRPRREQLEERTLLSVAYVDDSATGLNTGLSWTDAYTSLQSALTKAVLGDEIHVAQGTYKPTTDTDRTKSFALKTGVAIYGGYAGTEATDPDARNATLYPSILSGDIGTLGDSSDNSYHVVVGNSVDATAVLDGFTITAGKADGTTSTYNRGGGMYSISSSPTLTNCDFTKNTARYRGGGMYNDKSSPTLANCTFIANSAEYDGGGVYNYSSSPALANCTFTANAASYAAGGGMVNDSYSSPTLDDCTFTANSAGFGGGMYNYSSSSPALTNCTFISNSGNSGGGGMYNYFSSSPNLTNCTFTANSATYHGGGMYNDSSSPTLLNCTFATNSATVWNDGGGMYNDSWSSPKLTNCTFTTNSARDGGAMANAGFSSPTLTNCTFAANSATYYGGAMQNSHSASPTLINCTFTANLAGYGGGMYNEGNNLTLTDCAFIANSATGPSAFGGGMASFGMYPTLVNCTFTVNSASYGSGMYIYSFSSPTTLTNCILWLNTGTTDSQLDGDSTSAVTFCDVQGSYNGTGNINMDPKFTRSPTPGVDGTWGTADDDYGDLRLQPISPCIDAGNNAAVPAEVTTDMAGNPRFTDVPAIADTGIGTVPVVDMGAYEFTTPPIAGTGDNDEFTLSLTPDHASIQIVSPGGTNTYLVAAVTSLRFTGGAGGDRLTLDFTNGNPIPAGGIAFDAGSADEPGDSLVIQGTASGDNVLMGGNQVTVNGSTISSHGVEFFGFDLGEQTIGNLVGASGLYKTGPGTLVLSGTNTYLGGTTVEGGEVLVSGANALPSDTSLVINGGSVVLDTGLDQSVKVSGLRLNLGIRHPPATATASVGAATKTAMRTAQPAAGIVPPTLAPSTLSAVTTAIPLDVADASILVIAADTRTAAPQPFLSAAIGPEPVPVTTGPHPTSPRGRGVSAPPVAREPAIALVEPHAVTLTNPLISKTHTGINNQAARLGWLSEEPAATPAKDAVSKEAPPSQVVPVKPGKAHDAAMQAVISPHVADLTWVRIVVRSRTRLPVGHGSFDRILASAGSDSQCR